MKVPLLGVALIGGAIALIIYKKNLENQEQQYTVVGGMDEDE
ncbi:hypothetical protein [Clostridioides difficile]|nr:hypothetical protein [Clostridioides difficile]EQI98892.1 hypothetical protein QQS_3205 [Clostridioides difficile P6]